MVKFHEKFRTTAEAITSLSKCLFSGIIQSNTESYLDSYTKYQAKFLLFVFPTLSLFMYMHENCLGYSLKSSVVLVLVYNFLGVKKYLHLPKH